MDTTEWDNHQQVDKLLDDKLNNSSMALSLQQIAASTTQILGCLVAKTEVQEKPNSSKQRPKPYEIPASRTRTNGSQVEESRPTGIYLEYSDLVILNEAVSKLNEVVTRLNETYENQTSTAHSAAPPPQATFHVSYQQPPPTSSTPTTTTTSDDGIHILEYPTSSAGDISNYEHQHEEDEVQLDPLLNIVNGLSSCLKPCLIVSKDDNYVYEYTVQKKRCGNEYYCCSSCRKLPSPRSNLVIYFDGKIICSAHNNECIPIPKDESILRQQKRQIRFKKGDIEE